MTNHYTDVCEATIASLRQQLAAKDAEIDDLGDDLAQVKRKLAAKQDEVAELRQELGAVSEEFGLPKGIGPAPGEIKRILSELRQQLASALPSRCYANKQQMKSKCCTLNSRQSKPRSMR